MTEQRKFPLDVILYCAAEALERRGTLIRATASDLHKFLTNQATSMFAIESYSIANTTCGLIVLKQHSALKRVLKNTLPPMSSADAFRNNREFNKWLKTQQGRFGHELPITQVSARDLDRYKGKGRKIALRNIRACGIDLNDNPWL